MVEATHENWPPQKFCYLDSLLSGKMAAEFRKKAMRVSIPRLQRHMGSCCWRNTGLRERAKERSSQVCSGGWQLFVVAKFSWLRRPTKISTQRKFMRIQHVTDHKMCMGCEYICKYVRKYCMHCCGVRYVTISCIVHNPY